MTDGTKHKDKFDKRAANLRANLLKRKEQARKAKENQPLADDAATSSSSPDTKDS